MADEAIFGLRLALAVLGAYSFHLGLRAYRQRRSAPDSAAKRRLDRPWRTSFYGAVLFVGGLSLMVLGHYLRWPRLVHDVTVVAIYGGAVVLFIGAFWIGLSD